MPYQTPASASDNTTRYVTHDPYAANYSAYGTANPYSSGYYGPDGGDKATPSMPYSSSTYVMHPAYNSNVDGGEMASGPYHSTAYSNHYGTSSAYSTSGSGSYYPATAAPAPITVDAPSSQLDWWEEEQQQAAASSPVPPPAYTGGQQSTYPKPPTALDASNSSSQLSSQSSNSASANRRFNFAQHHVAQAPAAPAATTAPMPRQSSSCGTTHPGDSPHRTHGHTPTDTTSDDSSSDHATSSPVETPAPTPFALPKPRSAQIAEKREREQLGETTPTTTTESSGSTTPDASDAEKEKDRVEAPKEEPTWHTVKQHPAIKQAQAHTKPSTDKKKSAQQPEQPTKQDVQRLMARYGKDVGDMVQDSKSASSDSEDNEDPIQVAAPQSVRTAKKKYKRATAAEEEELLGRMMKDAANSAAEQLKKQGCTASTDNDVCGSWSLITGTMPAFRCPVSAQNNQKERHEIAGIRSAIRRAELTHAHMSKLEILSDALQLTSGSSRRQQRVPAQLVSEVMLRLAEVNTELNDFDRTKYFAAQVLQLAATEDNADAEFWTQPAVMLAHLFISHSHERLIEPVEATKELLVAFRIAVKLRNKRVIARCINHIAVQQELCGVFATQRQWYALGYEFASSCQDSRCTARLTIAEGTILLTLGEVEEAMRCFDRALPMAKQFKEIDSNNLISLYQLMAQSNMHRGNLPEAERMYRQQVAAATEAGDKITEAAALSELSIVQRHRNKSAASCETSLRELRMVSSMQYDQRECEALSNAGLMHRHAQMYDRAEDLLQRHVNLASKLEDPCQLAKAYYDLGELHRVRNQLDDALHCYMDSLVALERVPDEARRSYMTRVSIIEVEWRVLDAVELVHLRVGDIMSALRFASRKHVNPLVERCKRGRRMRTTAAPVNSERVAPQDGAEFDTMCLPAKADVEGLCTRIGVDAIVIFSCMWEDHQDFSVYVLHKDGAVDHKTLPVRASWFAALMGQDSSFLKLVRGGHNDTPLSSQALQAELQRGVAERRQKRPSLMDDLCMFYEEFISPISDFLPAADSRVSFILDGVLSNVPVPALRNPANGRFLIQDYSVNVAPSLQHLIMLAGESEQQGASSIASSPLQAHHLLPGTNNYEAMNLIGGATATTVTPVSPISEATSSALAQADSFGKVSLMLDEIETTTRDTAACNDLFKGLLTSQMKAKSGPSPHRLVLVNELPMRYDMREDWCCALSTTGPSPTNTSEQCKSLLFDSLEIAKGVNLDGCHLLVNTEVLPFGFRVVHEAAVPLHRAFHFAGAKRVLCLQWHQNPMVKGDTVTQHKNAVEAYLRGALRHLDAEGKATTVADALRIAALEDIAATNGDATMLAKSVGLWGCLNLSGLP